MGLESKNALFWISSMKCCLKQSESNISCRRIQWNDFFFLKDMKFDQRMKYLELCEALIGHYRFSTYYIQMDYYRNIHQLIELIEQLKLINSIRKFCKTLDYLNISQIF